MIIYNAIYVVNEYSFPKVYGSFNWPKNTIPKTLNSVPHKIYENKGENYKL